MDIIKNTTDKLLNERPKEWDDLPDLDLYMDQVISYMQRQHIGFTEGETLTPSMVNNYVKVGIMPRVKGKRYSKEHIAYLTIISLLKQIVPVSDISAITGDDLVIEDAKPQYELFSKMLEKELTKVGEGMSDIGDEKKSALVEKALSFAIVSYANKLACQSIIKELQT